MMMIRKDQSSARQEAGLFDVSTATCCDNKQLFVIINKLNVLCEANTPNTVPNATLCAAK
ncbi:hypothetical protein GCM10008019_43770 [Deinococcus soli (ex Cha et al. 2016)]|nr:hypothetical protein GCM10008019_43770 [Deinococcus soli (ex Cha et al. 2016)]